MSYRFCLDDLPKGSLMGLFGVFKVRGVSDGLVGEGSLYENRFKSRRTVRR